MRAAVSLALLPLAAVSAVRIIQSNDDGWAEQYIRTLNDALNAAGHDVVLSGPADNKSGSSSLDAEPSPRSSACQYNSCAADSGPVGSNATRPDLNWVNSYPVTAIKYGIDTFGPQRWDGAAPDLAVTGPNVGSNLWLAVPFSGTVGAACYAAHDAGIPALAFSGASTGTLAWDSTPAAQRSLVYAQLAATLTDKIVAAGKPYLPDDVFLNVNFPEVAGECTDPANFKWVLSRINPGVFSAPDTEWCGQDRLPTELDVISKGGCHISISVGDASDKTTVNDERQNVVLEKLKDILTCLP